MYVSPTDAFVSLGAVVLDFFSRINSDEQFLRNKKAVPQKKCYPKTCFLSHKTRFCGQFQKIKCFRSLFVCLIRVCL